MKSLQFIYTIFHLFFIIFQTILSFIIFSFFSFYFVLLDQDQGHTVEILEEIVDKMFEPL